MRLFVTICLIAAVLAISQAKPAKREHQQKKALVKDALAKRLSSLAELKKKSLEKKELAKKQWGSSSDSGAYSSSVSVGSSDSSSDSFDWDFSSWDFSSWDFSSGSGSDSDFWDAFWACLMSDYGVLEKKDYESFSEYSYQSDFWQCMAEKFPDWFEEDSGEKPEERPEDKPEDRPEDKPEDKPGDRPEGKPGQKPPPPKRKAESAKLQNRRRALLAALKQL